MREIKFRAINKDGYFIYGLPYTDGVNETVYYEEYNNRMCWRNEEGAHCNQPYKNGTLEQYTGLKDKNGKEIYEGDRCKFFAEGFIEYSGPVFWDEMHGAWSVGVLGTHCSRLYDRRIRPEVIGHIHEY